MVEPEPSPQNKNSPSWRVIGRSVRGASHVRKGQPNQDAIFWKENLDEGTAAIMAVSDGHGSADHFRSDRGSKIAVAVAVNSLSLVLHNFLEHSAPLPTVQRDLEDRLPRQLVHAWSEGVNRDIQANPLTAEELAALEEKAGEARRRAVETRPQLAYGCTLLAVLVTRSFALYLQIGDGDILAVSEEGEVYRPLGKDERLIANETTSLCSAEAWKQASMTFQVFSGPPPALVLASTDGYSNSFRNEEAFLQVGLDLLKISQEQSLDILQRSLEGWLNESSTKGSGDDVTLGIIKRLRATDIEQITRQIAELQETTRAANNRLAALEEERTREQSISDQDEIEKKINQLETNVQALVHEASTDREQRQREGASPLQRWSVGAAWIALALAGLVILYLSLLLPSQLTPAKSRAVDPEAGGGKAADVSTNRHNSEKREKI